MVRNTFKEGKSGCIPKKRSLATLSNDMMIRYVMVAIWFIQVKNIMGGGGRDIIYRAGHRSC